MCLMMYIVWIAFSTFLYCCATATTTVILRPLYRSTCVIWHLQLRTGGFCWFLSFTAHMPLLVVMATSTIGLGRIRWISSQQCYLRCLCTLYSCNSFLINIVITRCRQSPALTHLAAPLAACVQKQTVLWITRN